MHTITVSLGKKSYPLCIGAPLAGIGAYLQKGGYAKKALVVTNPKIKKLYFAALARSLERAGFAVSAAVIADGEKHKTLATVQKLYTGAVAAGLGRRSPVIALGGGVVGDIAGFFAATFLRGLPFVQVPTTLLAMVDSSVGGKTGVDLPQGKNLVGAFYQPKLVWIDLSVLKTLPAREQRNGMAEVIKYGIIRDKAFFEYLEKNVSKIKAFEPAAMHHIVAACCAIKAQVVAKDEREEKGLREILNFGHTFGHAIETTTGYQAYKHGEAVALGMRLACNLAARMKLLPAAATARVAGVLRAFGLPAAFKKEIPARTLIHAMGRDKKTRDGMLRFVLPTALGKVKIYDNVPLKLLSEVLR